MPTDLLLPLAGLALLDSTSFGTLLIPLWLLLAPGRLRPQRVLLFLGTVGVYYLVLGVALLVGATHLADALGAFLATPTAARVQLALGVALFVLSFRIGRTDRADAPRPAAVRVSDGVDTTADQGEAPPSAQPRTGRVQRWRERAMASEGRGSAAALIGLALAAAALETASMVPYLSAIGLLTAADVPMSTGVLVLSGYCVVMVLPALVLLSVRVVARDRLRRPLERLEGWLSRSAAEMTAWIVGIVGFLLAGDALERSGVLDLLG